MVLVWIRGSVMRSVVRSVMGSLLRLVMGSLLVWVMEMVNGHTHVYTYQQPRTVMGGSNIEY